jgi:hypothetical protein
VAIVIKKVIHTTAGIAVVIVGAGAATRNAIAKRDR